MPEQKTGGQAKKRVRDGAKGTVGSNDENGIRTTIESVKHYNLELIVEKMKRGISSEVGDFKNSKRQRKQNKESEIPFGWAYDVLFRLMNRYPLGLTYPVAISELFNQWQSDRQVLSHRAGGQLKEVASVESIHAQGTVSENAVLEASVDGISQLTGTKTYIMRLKSTDTTEGFGHTTRMVDAYLHVKFLNKSVMSTMITGQKTNVRMIGMRVAGEKILPTACMVLLPRHFNRKSTDFVGTVVYIGAVKRHRQENGGHYPQHQLKHRKRRRRVLLRKIGEADRINGGESQKLSATQPETVSLYLFDNDIKLGYLFEQGDTIALFQPKEGLEANSLEVGEETVISVFPNNTLAASNTHQKTQPQHQRGATCTSSSSIKPVTMPQHLALELQGELATQSSSQSLSQSGKDMAFVHLALHPHRVMIAEIRELLAGTSQLYVSSLSLLLKVNSITVEANPHSSRKSRNSSTATTTTTTTVLLEVEDGTGTMPVRVVGEEAVAIALKCRTGNLVFLSEVSWNPTDPAHDGKLVCNRIVNVNSIRAILSSDFIRRRTIKEIVEECVQRRRRQQLLLLRQRGAVAAAPSSYIISNCLDLLVCKATIAKVQVPMSGTLTRRTHIVCGRELSIEDEGLMSEIVRCPFCSNENDDHDDDDDDEGDAKCFDAGIGFREEKLLPSEDVVLTIDDGTASVEVSVIPETLEEMLDSVNAGVNAMRTGGPQLAQRLVGSEFMLHLCEVRGKGGGETPAISVGDDSRGKGDDNNNNDDDDDDNNSEGNKSKDDTVIGLIRLRIDDAANYNSSREIFKLLRKLR